MATDYRAMARQAAIAAGIDPNIFIAQINEESGFNPHAISPAGAIGIAQFMPGTAAGLGVNPWDPQSALYGAAKLDASYLQKYGGSWQKALASYNAGSGTVDYAIRAGGNNWISYLPAETRNYIRVILNGGSPVVPVPTPSGGTTNPGGTNQGGSGVQTSPVGLLPDWLTNPVRLLKMLTGLVLIGLGVWALLAPEGTKLVVAGAKIAAV